MDKEIENIITAAVAAGIERYREERKEEVRANKYHDTYILMKNYRSAKYHAENAVSDSSQLGSEFFGRFENLDIFMHTGGQSLLMLGNIDNFLA